LQGTSLTGDNFVTLNSQSTALAMVWSAMGVHLVIQEADLDNARQILGNLSEIKALGNLLEQKLANDPFVRNKNDSELAENAKTAILAAASTIDQGLSDGTFNERVVISALQKAVSTRKTTISPKEVDDIMVYEHDNSGNITLENDSQLYLSVKITAKDQTVLHPHITGLAGMVGPQDYITWASTKKFNQPQKKDSTVQVITPGFQAEYEPLRKIEWHDRIYVMVSLRTIIERLFFPLLGTVISWRDLGPPGSPVGLAPVNLTSAIMADLTDVGPIMEEIYYGNTKGALWELGMFLYLDLAKAGPITKTLFYRWSLSALGTRVIAKIAAKWAAKLSPIGGLLGVIDLLGIISNVTTATKTVTDIGSTDNIIEFDVNIELDIDEVIPGKVKADGKNKTFLIKGEGFSPVVRIRGAWPFEWKRKLIPQIAFTDNGTGFEYFAEPDYISQDGTQMRVGVAGDWLDKYIEGPLKVEVHHPDDEPESKVEKDPAVQIADGVEIASIDPSRGGKKVLANIYGAGFSNLISDNEVIVGTKSAAISGVIDSVLEIVIPDLDIGTYPVKARARFDGVWSDWSNTVNYEVLEGKVKITVCDDGSLKDDAFTLYVDGDYKGTLNATPGSYCATYSMELSVGNHTAMLVGIEAPDSVGTYSIGFTGVENIEGDSFSGNDLVPGIKKNYTFTVSATASTSSVKILKAFPYTPAVPDPENMLLMRE
jgi:hypothetical protein